MEDKPEKRGMPIYLDPADRGIANAMDDPDSNVDDWFPSNKAALKLWRCLESMLDLEEVLEFASQAKNTTKKKRKLKIAITPLHALISNIDDLLNDIENNPETKGRLEREDIENIIRIRTEFKEVLPHDNKSMVTRIRNKLSSHVDKKLHPTKAQELGSGIDQHEFGRWLHICLHVILDLTKLNVYSWSCKPPTDEHLTFMFNEPYIVTMKPDGEHGAELAALNISKSSPKNAIPESVEKLIVLSQWMFKKGQGRIASLKEDSKETWNTFSPNINVHKKSF